MRKFVAVGLAVLVLLVLANSIFRWTWAKYAYEPSDRNILNRTQRRPEAYDLWGRTLSREEAARLLRTGAGRAELSPQNGAVQIDDALLRLGRKTFYKETFGNEVFLTDVMGILNGPLRITNVAKAIARLKGGATTNLRVEVPETVSVGDRVFQEGSFFDTGLDVPEGALVPLGMSLSVSGWRLRAGITCALCHATVDAVTGKVVEGAPNQDLSAGLLLALGTNSASYFMHTDVNPLRGFPQDPNRAITLSTGARHNLPNIASLEKAVDQALLLWPRGNFDSLTDLQADPTQNPVSFTWGNYPYGWSGNFAAGPFHGLTSQNNNVHALNSDSLLLAASSPILFDMDTELFLAIVLQNSAHDRYRYDSSTHRKPSEFFAAVKPSPTSPGINQVVLPPTYPNATLLSPDGTLTSSRGYRFWEQNNAMAAWQNTIVPPPARIDAALHNNNLGRHVFERAGCSNCHSGAFLTNNKIISSEELGVNPVRSMALQKTERRLVPPLIFSFDTPVPIPAHPRVLRVPTETLDAHQIDLAWAHHGSGGGYKVPALAGLYWSAPYLHDGGIAVGKNVDADLGLPGTVQKNVMPDPVNSLRALIDRNLRSRVIAANEASPGMRRMNVQGAGHNYWIDSLAGFSEQDQQAVIAYLLSYVPVR